MNQSNTINWIASLRGLLVFLVFFSHQVYLEIDRDLMFIIGRIGVVGFFLISGFLAYNSVHNKNGKQFAWNRFLRLYPVYWLLCLLFYFCSDTEIPFSHLLANFTLFQQFVGVGNILGASWMLPIMVVFFVSLYFTKFNKKRTVFLYLLSCVMAIFLSVLRYKTGMPFPTAFFLLICVGLLPYYYIEQGKQLSKNLILLFVLFEIVLSISAYLSYESAWRYYVAYNLGFLVFVLFIHFDINVNVLNKFGALGFSFFLGADIPILVLRRIFPDIMNVNMFVLFVIEFLLALGLSIIVTRWVEKPLLSWGKSIELKLK